MDSTLNPYSPGAGKRPRYLAGRDDHLRAAVALIERANRTLEPGRPEAFWGRRGVGKTVLLRAIQAQFEAAGWITIGFECHEASDGGPAIRSKIERELVASVRKVASGLDKTQALVKRMLDTVVSFVLSTDLKVVSASLTVDPQKGRGDTQAFDFDLIDLVEDIHLALAPKGKGLAIFVDEAQNLDQPTLAALLGAQHKAQQENWNFYIFTAGLPNLPGYFAEARPYGERLFAYREIGQLAAADADAALRSPAAEQDVEYVHVAAEMLLNTSKGYPYFIQEYGFQAWNLAATSPITPQDAIFARAAGTAALDEGFFRSRWTRATKAEQKLMIAMSEDADSAPSQISDLVQRMGKSKPGDISVQRRGLLQKGLIYAPARGELAFAVPRMAEYIQRHHSQDTDAGPCTEQTTITDWLRLKPDFAMPEDWDVVAELDTTRAESS